jgi:predicted enzyme related to lactoylglutathione lyase
MELSRPDTQSQITFFYYRDLEAIGRFYGEVLGLELVQDQGWAMIYRVVGNAFLGIVAGDKGFHKPRDESAVLLTLVVDDVRSWYDYLKERAVNLLTEVKEVEEIGVRAFFLEDPGGYTLEIQEFVDRDVARLFR